MTPESPAFGAGRDALSEKETPRENGRPTEEECIVIELDEIEVDVMRLLEQMEAEMSSSMK